MNRALVAVLAAAALALTGCADTTWTPTLDDDVCVQRAPGVWVEADDGEPCINPGGRWVEAPGHATATRRPAPKATSRAPAPKAPRPKPRR